MKLLSYILLLSIGACSMAIAQEQTQKGTKMVTPKKTETYHPVPLTVGEKAPDFQATDSDNKQVKLSDYAGKKVVLYFYPKSNTYGCNAQAFSFRDNAGAYKRNNIEVLGISYDTPEFQNEFKQMYALPFTLLSDQNKEIAKKYATYQVNNDYVPARVTFLIDENGIIFAIMKENAADPRDRIIVSTHAQDILKRWGFTGEQLRPY